MATVTIKGLDQLRKKLDKITDTRTVRLAVQDAATHVKGKIADYPEPPPPKNKTPGHGWYDRLQGGKYMTVAGEIHNYGGSEKLGPSWTVRTRRGGMAAEIGNDTTYGKWVQDKDFQTAVHQATGWPTIQETAEKEEKYVLDEIKKAIDKALKG